jgi:hypothetical protein
MYCVQGKVKVMFKNESSKMKVTFKKFLVHLVRGNLL